MRARTLAVAVAAFFVVSATTAVRAHHSYANFDLDRTVTVEGRIDDILFANPHVVMKLRAGDGTVYTVTWNAAQQLSRQGVSPTHLKVGDSVGVTGSPSTKSPEVSKIVEVTRPADGWTWRSSVTQGGVVGASR